MALPTRWRGQPCHILTFVITDRGEHSHRVLGPPPSGFRDVDTAWSWNCEAQARDLFPNETRLDTTGQLPEHTTAAALELISSWVGQPAP